MELSSAAAYSRLPHAGKSSPAVRLAPFVVRSPALSMANVLLRMRSCTPATKACLPTHPSKV